MKISIQRILAGMLLVPGMTQAETPVAKAYSTEKPNILLIISDDQGYGDFGFMGNTVLRTPQLDKLAASGAIFENYSTGVACSPGRAMLFTGRNHLSTGVWGVGARYGLRRDETLMPMFFRENGYSTFYLGKGDCVAPHRMSPHYAGWQESLFVGGYQHHNGRLYHTPLAPLHSIKPVDVEGWTSEFMTQRGIEFMKEKKGSPWLMTMAYIIPHTPWKPVDERYAPYYRDQGCSENIAACFSHIEQMDTCVGQLLDALKETGQDENTIVVFVSDNGQTGPCVKKPGAVGGWIDHPDWAIRNVAGLRGNKSTAWENGTRVPLLVRMPGTIPVGQRTQFATAEDLLPTLLDVAGIPQDSVAHKPISGISLRSALLDEKAKIEHPEVFRITSWGEHSLTGNVGYIPEPTAMKLEDYQAVLRGPKFKMMMYPGGKVELYDIVKDKAESKDISKKHPEVTARMLVECRRQFRALIDDGAFRHSTIYIGDPSSKNRGGRTYFDSARRIQSHTGNVRAIPTLNGFAKEGDSVTYTIDSAAAGMYAISLTGTFADAAPLRVEVAGNVLLQQALNGNKLTFGTVNLPKGQFPLRLVAGKPKGEARAATVDDIFFEASRPAASKPLAEANRTLRKHADIDHSPVRLTNPKALADRVRGHVNSQPLRFPNQHWVRGAYYAGLMAMYESTSDRAYLDDCMKWGKQVSWAIKEQGGGPYESGAYPLICGQIWYGCYQAKKDELMMRPTLAFLEDPKVENPLSAPGEWYLENTGHRFVDGLFTAPPALAMLYQMTGDEKYVGWMDACFWDVHEEIFDHDAGLFYRDARSKPRKTKNGKKVLWSRGNGWAFGGLTRILKYLPGVHPSYPKYKSLYMKMAESLAKRQQADGFWRSNLDDPEQYTMKESSGTGFFTYGIAWGINNGILNRERFLPVARKAWTALASVVNEDGKVGWSQPAGGGPGKVAEADTSKFGAGIFLLAASEVYLLPLSNASLSAQQRETIETVRVDVVVYGGTPGGVTAAIAAARDGASVILLEQTRHVGGLTTSGLNRDECNHLDRPTLGSLCEQFLEEAVKRSNGRWTEGSSRTWQSGIAERVFLEMLKDAGVVVRYEQLLDRVEKDGARITELRVRGGESYRAKVFIDATYEGDLMAKAGVSYAIGRESADQYGESIAGVRYLDDKVAISPFDDDGKLLFGVMPGKPPIAGSASEVPICYNVRLNLTTEEANRVPIEKPGSYDPMQHELLARALEAGLFENLTAIIGLYPMGDSDKRELNNRQFSIVSMSIPGAQTPWAEASFEEREAIHQKYRDYTHGMLWFLKTDLRVPKHIRSEMALYGFCKDEWADNDHWPHYLYIRAARRMQGEIILTEADVIDDRDKEDVIHVGSHFIDCHHAARYVSDSGHIINEGRIWKQGARFDIPYRAITPKAAECSNLLVPVCASASHVAFCTIRLEPTWMHLGEAAGIAAAMAGKSGKSVQEVDIQSLQARLLELGIPLEHPEGPMAYEKKRGKPRTFAPDDVVKEFFASADKNGDGMASKSEWDSARPTWKWLFVHIDKDKNGQLDRAEYKAFQDYKKENPDWRGTLESQ